MKIDVSRKIKLTASSWFMAAVVFTTVGSLALFFDWNPSSGAKPDFLEFHYPSIERYWLGGSLKDFLSRISSTSGPTFFVLCGEFFRTPEGVRAFTLSLHILTALGIGVMAGPLPLNISLMLAAAFFFSPFQLGPALWGHAETFAMALTIPAIALARRNSGGAAALLAIALSTRQNVAAGIGALGLNALLERDLRAMLYFALSLAGGVIVLYWAYGGLAPKTYGGFMTPNFRSYLLSVTLISLSMTLIPDFKKLSFNWSDLAFFGIAILLCVVFYNLSSPIARGGYVFSRIDSWESLHYSFRIASPSIMAIILTWAWVTKTLSLNCWLAILGASAVVGMSSIVYVKYVDFLVWMLAFCFLNLEKYTCSRRQLVYSLGGWTVLNFAQVIVWHS